MKRRLTKLPVKFLIMKVKVPPFRQILETSGTAAPICIKTFLLQKILGFNRAAYWPTHLTSVISSPQNIEIGIGTAPGLSPNCYIQGKSGIKLGDYSLVGPGVGIISTNHDIYDIKSHSSSRGVVIGSYCWIGMNAVILPGVRLGDHTIVAAGAIVTKSFPNGYCVLAGNPARVVKNLEPKAVRSVRNKYEYVGYYDSSYFFRKKETILGLIYNPKLDSFDRPQR